MTPANVVSRVRDQLAETTAAFWTDAEIYRYLTDAEREVNLTVEYNLVSTAATTVTNTSGYTLPSDCLSLKRITYDGVPLRRVDAYKRDIDGLDMPGYGSSGQTGNPTHYYQINNMVYLWPVPQEAKTVQYYCHTDTAEVTAAASFTLPPNYHVCMQDYCLYRCFLKDQDQGKSEWYKREYLQGLADAQRREQSRKWGGGFPTIKDVNANYTALGGLT